MILREMQSGHTIRKVFYIHVGMPKTGTTYLQRRFFPNVEGIEYWEPFKHPMSFYFERFRSTNYVTFPEGWKQTIRTYISESQVTTHIISFEGLFGSYADNYRANFTNALLIKEIFPNVKLILTLRNQISLIESNYSQLVSQGYTGSIKRYINYKNGRFLNNRSVVAVNLNLNSLHYHHYIKNYYLHFGKENVLILLYEQLKVDPEKYKIELVNFLGNPTINEKQLTEIIQDKKALNVYGIQVNRFLNHFFRFELNNYKGLLPKSPYLFELKSYKAKFPVLAPIYYTSKYFNPSWISRALTFFLGQKRFKLDNNLKSLLIEEFRESNSTTSGLLRYDLYSYWKEYCQDESRKRD